MTTHADRRAVACQCLSLGSELVFVTFDLPTIQYLTGFTGSNGALALQAGTAAVATDGRYIDQIASEAPDVTVAEARDPVAGIIPTIAGRRVLLDDRTPAVVHARLSNEAADVELIENPVAAHRMVKDEGEREALRKACDITRHALEDTASTIRVGDTEVSIARRLEARFGELGAQDRAFPSIVGSGPNSAIPHHRAGDRRLIPGDLLVIDCGAQVDGYHADMTRTFIVADTPEPWQRQIHDIVQRAQRAGIAAIAPGCSARAVDGAAREIIAEAGFADSFTHGTGHGVGLEIHEAPMINQRSGAHIPMGSVITVEPGIYVPGQGGVRIEDTVLVDESVQVLTDLPRALTRVG